MQFVLRKWLENTKNSIYGIDIIFDYTQKLPHAMYPYGLLASTNSYMSCLNNLRAIIMPIWISAGLPL